MNKQELLKKLRALAEQGVGGEAVNAQKKLQELMQKYGITEFELDDDAQIECVFEYHTERERQLLIQIIYKVMNVCKVFNFVYTKSKRACRTKLGCYATASQRIEIEFLFDFYRKLYTREEKYFFNAFVQKHRLFGESDDEDDKELNREEVYKIYSLMSGLSDETPLKQVENKKV